ncbi:Fe-S cluster assembly protein HesB [Prosthecochloris sp. HL-130-GSB]|jgi:A/G-specific adenine glycosylase|uniref:Fe-S cluster assembly protein HesB n=1 Tax=Prosthecochloris sp. HL-130-GSB TaxID=1974213 RepID=UPI001E46524E|nr:Fe-S cluster assembly protein HesB [Prosthecochloris sp. HL-130-GSB]
MIGMDNRNTEQRVREFQDRIFDFYEKHARSFPWRETTDRYAVMVSEIMLQQTQAVRVVDKYLAWLDRFPDIPALAGAPLKEVLTYWSGLGYNARGERLQRAAKVICEEYGGIVPADPAELIRLPGIGPYTSRSIPVFADNMDVAAVDTNIRRIFVAELGLDVTAGSRELQAVAEEVLPQGRSRKWHNALMDYGALVLTSRRSGIAPRTRQGTFRGSRRWYRSHILRDLLACPGGLLYDELDDRYRSCPYELMPIMEDLEKDRLVERVDAGNSGILFRVRES